jgi:hypothetical protein
VNESCVGPYISASSSFRPLDLGAVFLPNSNPASAATVEMTIEQKTNNSTEYFILLSNATFAKNCEIG